MEWSLEDKPKSLVKLTLILVFLFVSLSPYIFNGFWADDCVISHSYYFLKATHGNYLKSSWDLAMHWAKGGRVFPVAVIANGIFYWFFHVLITARLAQVVLIIANIGLASLLVFRWSSSLNLVLVFIPVLTSLFQMRIPFDPMGANPPLLQLLFFECVGAIYLQYLYLKNQKKIYLFSSLFLLGLGYMTYELSLIFFPVFLIQPLLSKKNFKKALPVMMPYIGLLGSYLALIFFLRSLNAAPVYDGVSFSFAPKRILRGYWHQFFSAFPLSYLRGSPEFGISTVKPYGYHSISAKLSVILGMVLVYFGLSPRKGIKKPILSPNLLLFGTSMMFLSPIVIALSKRWQEWVTPGKGYLPVYFAYFGVAVLGSLAVYYIVNGRYLTQLSSRVRESIHVQELVKIGVTVFIGWLLFINHLTNQHVANLMDMTYKYPRSLLYNSFEKGLVDGTPEGSRFILPSRARWQWASKYISEKLLHIDSIKDFDDYKDTPEVLNDSKLNYFLAVEESRSQIQHKGWVFFAHLIQKSKSESDDLRDGVYLFENPKIYLESAKKYRSQMTIYCHKKLVSTVKKVSYQDEDGKILELDSFACPASQVSIDMEIVRE